VQRGDSQTESIDLLRHLGTQPSQLRALTGGRQHSCRFLQLFAKAPALGIQQQDICAHVRDRRMDARVEALGGGPSLMP
jgi:hypothetical protein